MKKCLLDLNLYLSRVKGAQLRCVRDPMIFLVFWFCSLLSGVFLLLFSWKNCDPCAVNFCAFLKSRDSFVILGFRAFVMSSLCPYLWNAEDLTAQVERLYIKQCARREKVGKLFGRTITTYWFTYIIFFQVGAPNKSKNQRKTTHLSRWYTYITFAVNIVDRTLYTSHCHIKPILPTDSIRKR
jgi:hypothetical protein